MLKINLEHRNGELVYEVLDVNGVRSPVWIPYRDATEIAAILLVEFSDFEIASMMVQLKEKGRRKLLEELARAYSGERPKGVETNG